MKLGSVWAIADQSIASAGNFVTILFLARALPPKEFGTFALLNAACLILIGLHSALIVSPLVVLGASAEGEQSRTYSAAAAFFTVAFLPISFGVIFLPSVSLDEATTGLLAVVYMLAWQLQETARRSLIAALRYRAALLGDCVSYVGQAVLVGLWVGRGHGSLDGAYALMATTSVAAAALQFWQSGAKLPTRAEMRSIRRSFWSLGRWLFAGSIISSLAGPLIPWLLNWFHGREAAATFQSVFNVLSLSNPIINSIAAIVIPTAAKFVLRQGDPRGLRRFALHHTFKLELLLAPLFLALVIWPRFALALFYGESSPYCEQTLSLRIAVLAWMLLVPMTVCLAALTGAGKTKSNAIVLGVGTAAAIVCGPPLIIGAGVAGGMLAATVNRAASALMALRILAPAPEGHAEGAAMANDLSPDRARISGVP